MSDRLRRYLGEPETQVITLAHPVALQDGTTDYNELENKPTINGVVLEGDLTSDDLGIKGPTEELTIDDLEIIILED